MLFQEVERRKKRLVQMQSLINETKSNDEASKATSVIKEIQTKETEPTKN